MVIKRGLKRIFREGINWITMSILFFLIGSLFGYLIFIFYTDSVMENIETLIGGIEQLSREVFQSTFIKGSYLIFVNNIRAVTLMLFGGIVFGIIPFISLIFNGLVIGVFLGLLFYQGFTLTYFMAGIIPHGIFEIPAIIIAGAFGMKIGVNLLIPGRGYTRKTQFLQNLADVIKLYLLMIILLIIAAMVEVGITPLIAQRFTTGGAFPHF